MRWIGPAANLDAVDVRSDGSGEFGERGRDAAVWSGVETEFVVAAANVLHERVTEDDHPCRVVTFQSAHRPEPCLQAAVVGFDPIVRILLSVMKRGGHEFVDHRAQRRRPVGHYLHRRAMSAERGLEEPARRSVRVSVRRIRR